MSDIVEKSRTTKERAYGGLMIAIGIIAWPFVIFGLWKAIESHNPVVLVYLFYGVAIGLFLWISGIAYRALAYGNMVRLGPDQFPQLYKQVVAGADQLGLHPTPTTFLYNSNGLLNAFARRILGGRFVFLTSALVEASNDEQVSFVIGHELGHHAAGHLNHVMAWIRGPAFVVPFLRRAYSRARETTCDSIGANLTQNQPVSQSALLMLGCGCGRLNASLNCEAFIAQEKDVPPIFGFLTEIFRTHPRLTRRVAAIKAEGVEIIR